MQIEIIQEIFNHWNNAKIVIHRKLTNSIAHSVNARLTDYTPDEIKESITNYRQVLESPDHWFTYKWTLRDFLSRGGWERFLSINAPLESFRKNFISCGVPNEIKELGTFWLKVNGGEFLKYANDSGIDSFVAINRASLETIWQCARSVERAKMVIERASKYYKERELPFTLHTIARNMPDFI